MVSADSCVYTRNAPTPQHDSHNARPNSFAARIVIRGEGGFVWPSFTGSTRNASLLRRTIKQPERVGSTEPLLLYIVRAIASSRFVGTSQSTSSRGNVCQPYTATFRSLRTSRRSSSASSAWRRKLRCYRRSWAFRSSWRPTPFRPKWSSSRIPVTGSALSSGTASRPAPGLRRHEPRSRSSERVVAVQE